MTAIPQISAGELGSSVRTKLNKVLRQNSQPMDLNYDCSFDPATSDHVQFKALWDAAVAAMTPARPEIRLHFGPGTVNLSGLTTIQLPDNAIVRLSATAATNIILASWSAAGTSTYGDLGLFMFYAADGMDFIFKGNGAFIWGGGLMTLSPAMIASAYSTWPHNFRRCEAENLNGDKVRRGLFRFAPGAAATTQNAQFNNGTGSAGLVGDGTTKSFTVGSVTNVAPGQRFFFDMPVGVDNSWRKWEGRIQSVDVPTNTITLTKAPPTGVVLPASGIWFGLIRPFYFFDYFKIKNIYWDFVPDNDQAHNVVCFSSTVCIGGKHFIAENITVKHGQKLGGQFGTTADFWSEYYLQSLDIDGWRSIDHVHSDTTAGGELLRAGFNSANLNRFTSEGNLALNDTDVTVKTAAVSDQRYVEVVEDLTVLRKKAGFAIVNGEPDTWALAATNLAATVSTTVTGGDVAAGATVLTGVNGAAFAARGVLRVLTGGTLRFYGFTRSSNTFTLDEVTDGIVLNGATIDQFRSNNQQPGNVFMSPNTTKFVLMEVDSYPPEGTKGFFSIVAVDTARPGAHRIYFDNGWSAPGYIPAGRVIQIVDVNKVADDGDEIEYAKATHSMITNFTAYDKPSFQGVVTFKGGEYDRNPLHSTNSGRGGKLLTFNLIFSPRRPILTGRQSIGVYIQQSDVTVAHGHFLNAGQGLLTHNQTPQSNILCHDLNFYDQMNGIAINFQNAGGRKFIARDCKVNWHPFQSLSISAYRVEHSKASPVYFQDFEDISLINCSADTSRRYDELTMSIYGAISLRENHNLVTDTYAMRGVYIDGNLGQSRAMAALWMMGGGRIGGVRFGPNFDISGYTGAKSTLITYGDGASRLASTLSVAAVTDDYQVTIQTAHAQKIPKGSHISITLDSAAVHSTWTTAEGGADGVLPIEDRIPSAAAIGKAVTIRPYGEIQVDPLARDRLGLRYSKLVKVAAGQPSVSLDIAGKFPCFANSPGGPRPEKCFARTRTGDILAPKFTVTPNNTSQAGGSVLVTFFDPASQAAENLAADTVMEIGYDETVIRFQ